MTAQQPDGAHSEAQVKDTVEFSVPLPRSLDTRLYVRLTTQSKAIIVFLTTASADELGSPAPMGSFVYALPDVRAHLTQPLRGPSGG